MSVFIFLGYCFWHFRVLWTWNTFFFFPRQSLRTDVEEVEGCICPGMLFLQENIPLGVCRFHNILQLDFTVWPCWAVSTFNFTCSHFFVLNQFILWEYLGQCETNKEFFFFFRLLYIFPLILFLALRFFLGRISFPLQIDSVFSIFSTRESWLQAYYFCYLLGLV